MRKNINRILGIFLSLLMILSVITIPSFKSKAAAGTVDDFVLLAEVPILKDLHTGKASF